MNEIISYNLQYKKEEKKKKDEITLTSSRVWRTGFRLTPGYYFTGEMGTAQSPSDSTPLKIQRITMYYQIQILFCNSFCLTTTLIYV